jgi:hypothetical protein
MHDHDRDDALAEVGQQVRTAQVHVLRLLELVHEPAGLEPEPRSANDSALHDAWLAASTRRPDDASPN